MSHPPASPRGSAIVPQSATLATVTPPTLALDGAAAADEGNSSWTHRTWLLPPSRLSLRVPPRQPWDDPTKFYPIAIALRASMPPPPPPVEGRSGYPRKEPLAETNDTGGGAAKHVPSPTSSTQAPAALSSRLASAFPALAALVGSGAPTGSGTGGSQPSSPDFEDASSSFSLATTVLGRRRSLDEAPPPPLMAVPEYHALALCRSVVFLGEQGSGKSTFKACLGNALFHTMPSTMPSVGASCSLYYHAIGGQVGSPQSSAPPAAGSPDATPVTPSAAGRLTLQIVDTGSGYAVGHGYSLPYADAACLFINLAPIKQKQEGVLMLKKHKVLVHEHDRQSIVRFVHRLSAVSSGTSLFVIGTHRDVLSDTSDAAVDAVLAEIRSIVSQSLLDPRGRSGHHHAAPATHPNPTAIQQQHHSAVTGSPALRLVGVFAVSCKDGRCTSENRDGPKSITKLWSLICDSLVKDVRLDVQAFAKRSRTLALAAVALTSGPTTAAAAPFSDGHTTPVAGDSLTPSRSSSSVVSETGSYTPGSRPVAAVANHNNTSFQPPQHVSHADPFSTSSFGGHAAGAASSAYLSPLPPLDYHVHLLSRFCNTLRSEHHIMWLSRRSMTCVLLYLGISAFPGDTRSTFVLHELQRRCELVIVPRGRAAQVVTTVGPGRRGADLVPPYAWEQEVGKARRTAAGSSQSSNGCSTPPLWSQSGRDIVLLWPFLGSVLVSQIQKLPALAWEMTNVVAHHKSTSAFQLQNSSAASLVSSFVTAAASSTPAGAGVVSLPVGSAVAAASVPTSRGGGGGSAAVGGIDLQWCQAADTSQRYLHGVIHAAVTVPMSQCVPSSAITRAAETGGGASSNWWIRTKLFVDAVMASDIGFALTRRLTDDAAAAMSEGSFCGAGENVDRGSSFAFMASPPRVDGGDTTPAAAALLRDKGGAPPPHRHVPPLALAAGGLPSLRLASALRSPAASEAVADFPSQHSDHDESLTTTTAPIIVPALIDQTLPAAMPASMSREFAAGRICGTAVRITIAECLDPRTLHAESRSPMSTLPRAIIRLLVAQLGYRWIASTSHCAVNGLWLTSECGGCRCLVAWETPAASGEVGGNSPPVMNPLTALVSSLRHHRTVAKTSAAGSAAASSSSSTPPGLAFVFAFPSSSVKLACLFRHDVLKYATRALRRQHFGHEVVTDPLVGTQLASLDVHFGGNAGPPGGVQQDANSATLAGRAALLRLDLMWRAGMTSPVVPR